MSDIKVKVSGKGQLNIGNLAQGQQVNIHSGTGDMRVGNGGALYEQMMRAVHESAGGANQEPLEELEEKVKALSKALQAEPKNTSKIKQMLDLIKEHHEWAFPAIAAVVAKVGPMVAALL
jgi:thiamine kinase-like enzyme